MISHIVFFTQRERASGSGVLLLWWHMEAEYYKTGKWESMRNSILRRDGYQCQLSKRYGKLRQAEVVHHIFPWDEFPEYAYEPWNLISITISEHNKLHDRNTNELTDAGIELLTRTARKYNKPIPDKYLHPVKKRYKRERRSKY